MKQEKINVNGKFSNKLEEIIKLIRKLNEGFYTEDEFEEKWISYYTYIEGRWKQQVI